MFKICFNQNPTVSPIHHIYGADCKYTIKNIVFFETYAFENRKRVFDSSIVHSLDHCLVTFWVENKKGRLKTLLAKDINIKVLLVHLCNN
jgi:hypothetical protein